MKNISKSILKILFISFFTILFSCEKDLYEESIINKSRATSQKVSISQVLSEINNPILKKYIKNELNQQIGISELRLNFEDYLSFIKIIKENEYVTYSLLINKYSQSQPFEKYFVITKNGSIENAGYSKYIPNDPIIDFNPNNFTGKIQVIDLQNEVKSETAFINSIAQPQTESFNCVNSVSVIAHNCSYSGNHPPGTPCTNGQVNDGYWEIVTTVICTYNNDYEYIAPPPAFMGEPSGGGAPATFNTEVLAFIYTLTDDEYNAIKDMPDVLTYLEENNASVESQNFIREIIYRIQDNPGVFKSIKPFLIEKKIDDSQLDPCTKEILTQLKGLQSSDIAKILAKLNNNIIQVPSYNTKIVIEDPVNSPDAMAQTNWEAVPNPNGPQPGQGVALHFNYLIKIRPSYLNGSMLSNPPRKPTQLSIARTLLHEIIHAYFDSMFDDCYINNNCTEIKQFPELWNAFTVWKNGGIVPQNAQHLTIAKEFTNILARALQEFQTGNPVSDNTEPEQDYKDLAWQGLLGNYPNPNPDNLAQLFNLEYPIGSAKRTRFENINAAEDSQQVSSGITPKSTPCN